MRHHILQVDAGSAWQAFRLLDCLLSLRMLLRRRVGLSEGAHLEQRWPQLDVLRHASRLHSELMMCAERQGVKMGWKRLNMIARRRRRIC